MPQRSIDLPPRTLLITTLFVVTMISAAAAQDAKPTVPKSLSAQELANQVPVPFWIGVRCTNTGEANNLKVIVRNVIPRAPAATAGIEPGDELVAVNDTKLQSVEQLGQIIRRSDGKRLSITVRRGQRLIDVQLVPARRTVVDYTMPSGMDSKELALWIQRQANSGLGPGINLRFMNPGIVMPSPPPELPAGTEFRIKQVDEQIQIVVRQGEDEWIVSPDTISELPPQTRRWAVQLRNLTTGTYASIHSMPAGLSVLLPSPRSEVTPQATGSGLDLEAENKRLAARVEAMDQQIKRLQQIIQTLNSQQPNADN